MRVWLAVAAVAVSPAASAALAVEVVGRPRAPRLRGPSLLQGGLRGVRDGGEPVEVDFDPARLGDDITDRNYWTGASKDKDFEFLDDLNPIAPMDSVSPISSVSTLGLGPLPGEHHNYLYVPPYRYPDAFPKIHGGTCTCETPPVVPATKQQKAWAKKVAKSLGIKVVDLPKPMSPTGATTCNCTSPDGKAVSFHWANFEPIAGTRKFTLSPADISYSGGNYWKPSLRAGLAAPQDRLPVAYYPLQAGEDEIEHIPVVAQEDRVNSRFARYMDQVEDRSLGCDGDGVSDRCTTKCAPGDAVMFVIGPTRVAAQIVSTHVNGAVVIKLSPHLNREDANAEPCPAEAACSIFRTCRRHQSFCVETEGKRSRDYLGNMRLSLACPRGTTPCSTIEQVVSGKYLTKDGLTCKPVGPPSYGPPPL